MWYLTILVFHCCFWIHKALSVRLEATSLLKRSPFRYVSFTHPKFLSDLLRIWLTSFVLVRFLLTAFSFWWREIPLLPLTESVRGDPEGQRRLRDGHSWTDARSGWVYLFMTSLWMTYFSTMLMHYLYFLLLVYSALPLVSCSKCSPTTHFSSVFVCAVSQTER